VFLRINGERHYLWRAVDQNGVVLDILVRERHSASAAKRFFRRLLAGLKYRPRQPIADGLRSYGAARREVLPEVRHRTGRYLNNRAENSHRPTRRRERQMQRFKSPGQAQRFLWVRPAFAPGLRGDPDLFHPIVAQGRRPDIAEVVSRTPPSGSGTARPANR
jgi:transposase-like protein